MDDIKRFNDKFVVFVLLTAMMVVFIPSTSSKYVKEYSLVYNLSTKLAQAKIVWTNNTGANPPAVTTFSNVAEGFTSTGYYLLVAKGGNGALASGSGVTFNSGYGGTIAGVYYFNPADVTFEIALGTSATGGTAGKTKLREDAYVPPGQGGSSTAPSGTGGGGFAGGGATMLLVVNSAYNNTSNHSSDTTAAINRLVLIGGGGGGSSMYENAAQTFKGGDAGSNFITATTEKVAISTASSFNEYIGDDGAGADGKYGVGGVYATSPDSIQSGRNKGSRLYKWLMHGQGVGCGTAYDSDYPSPMGGGGGGGFAGGGAGTTYAGAGGGGSSALNNVSTDTARTATKLTYYSCSAAKLLELYKKNMSSLISSDHSLSAICELGDDGRLYQKNTDYYADVSFVAICYLGTTAP